VANLLRKGQIRIPFFLKILTLFFIFVGVFYVAAQQIVVAILQSVPPQILKEPLAGSQTTLLIATGRSLTVSITLIFSVFFGLCLGIFFVDAKRHVVRMNRTIRKALHERKLDKDFDHFYVGQSKLALSKNVGDLFGLFKSFDLLKANRIFLEVNSLKTLIDHISEGVLLLNKDKIVTHINPEGERLLRLLPGEIIGQIVVRKISDEHFISLINEAVDKDQKISNETITIKEGQPIKLNIFPIQNKFGESIRVMIILSEKKAPKAAKAGGKK